MKNYNIVLTEEQKNMIDVLRKKHYVNIQAYLKQSIENLYGEKEGMNEESCQK